MKRFFSHQVCCALQFGRADLNPTGFPEHLLRRALVNIESTCAQLLVLTSAFRNRGVVGCGAWQGW